MRHTADHRATQEHAMAVSLEDPHTVNAVVSHLLEELSSDVWSGLMTTRHDLLALVGEIVALRETTKRMSYRLAPQQLETLPAVDREMIRRVRASDSFKDQLIGQWPRKREERDAEGTH